jgi:putative transposase
VSKLRRYNKLGNAYFITSVTHERNAMLREYELLLMSAISVALRKHSFELSGWVVLPEHVHLMVWSGAVDLSLFMKSFKQGFGLKYRQQQKAKSGRIWQLRFWDHIIRDQDDFNRHLDYIHYNPVKHGLVLAPLDYPYSSFTQYVNEGYYHADWGQRKVPDLNGDFGE